MLTRAAVTHAATGTTIDVATLRRRALWVLLATKVVGGWGLGWDIRWHLSIGRDSFWIPPHLMTYAAVAMLAIVSLGVLALETWTARGARHPGTLSVAGLTGTRGFHLAWWGIALTILAAPIDDLWHRLFGLDVTLWSPPHLLGLAGAQINTLGVLLIALECWPATARARAVALAAGGALLLWAFQVLMDQGVQVAYRHGGVLFFTWSILGSLAFTFALVLMARLWPWRAAALVVAVGAVLVQASTILVADLGFALVRPVSALSETIAADPSSPVAVANEMARLNNAVPGRSLMLRLFVVLPAALLVIVDARRRRRAASLAFGAALFVVSGVMLSRSPALRHVAPSIAAVPWGAGLALLAALAGGAAGAGLARRLLAAAAVTAAGTPAARR
jgi:hypothetical protein